MATMTSFDRDTTAESKILAQFLDSLRARARMEMVFGGPVTEGATALKITELSGTRTSSPLHLVVENGHGLGGKALAIARPVSVASYFSSDGITHRYDHAVRPEAIETLAALPVMVDRRPRALVYLAARTQVSLGDRWHDSLMPLTRELSQKIAVEDEVRSRLKTIRSTTAGSDAQVSRLDLHDIASELALLAPQVSDADLRRKIEEIGRRCAAGLQPPTGEASVTLRQREVDVLREVALGSSNAEVAESLGLLPNTVKSYFKTAMARLHAKNRMQAVIRAQELGLL